ncbi:MAG: hypothetical protein ABIJ43_02075 [Candidatus Beckwithbacteria bacterium]|nr:hypothetical protein [Patescibacteria group bacterium]
MPSTALTKARNIIKKNPSLIWYTKGYDQLDLKAITEAVLNYGSWEQFLELKSILTTKKLGFIYHQLANQKRCNLHPLVKNYFKFYFNKYAS